MSRYVYLYVYMSVYLAIIHLHSCHKKLLEKNIFFWRFPLKEKVVLSSVYDYWSISGGSMLQLRQCTVWTVSHTHRQLFISVSSDSLSRKRPGYINRRVWMLSLSQIVVHRPHLSLWFCWTIGCVLPISGEKDVKNSHF